MIHKINKNFLKSLHLQEKKGGKEREEKRVEGKKEKKELERMD